MKRRVITALAVMPPVLIVLLCALPQPIAVLAATAVAIGSIELKELATRGRRSFPAVSGLAAFGGGAAAHLGGWSVDWLPVLVLVGLAAVFASVRRTASRLTAEAASLYVAAPVFALFLLHQQRAQPGVIWDFSNPVLMAMLPLWAGDTAAIFVGRWIGRHPLAPTLSPKKTWEGSIANFLACVLVAWACAPWLQVETWKALACGAAIGVFGQAGDLLESALKRAAEKKDSGGLLPGHGGILDRIDSLLLASIPVWLILR